jgi:geranylgeranyl pyrophosphate synthase
MKTGALFVAAAEAGARIAGLKGAELTPIRQFGENLGLAYQTRDDLVDVWSTREVVGKDVGVDIGKTTFVSLLGSDDATQLNHSLVTAAIRCLDPLGPRIAPLQQLARSLYVIDPDQMIRNDSSIN